MDSIFDNSRRSMESRKVRVSVVVDTVAVVCIYGHSKTRALSSRKKTNVRGKVGQTPVFVVFSECSDFVFTTRIGQLELWLFGLCNKVDHSIFQTSASHAGRHRHPSQIISPDAIRFCHFLNAWDILFLRGEHPFLRRLSFSCGILSAAPSRSKLDLLS